MSILMKKPSVRDWPFTIAMTVLLIVTLVLAFLDPSCQYRGEWPALPTR